MNATDARGYQLETRFEGMRLAFTGLMQQIAKLQSDLANLQLGGGGSSSSMATVYVAVTGGGGISGATRPRALARRAARRASPCTRSQGALTTSSRHRQRSTTRTCRPQRRRRRWSRLRPTATGRIRCLASRAHEQLHRPGRWRVSVHGRLWVPNRRTSCGVRPSTRN